MKHYLILLGSVILSLTSCSSSKDEPIINDSSVEVSITTDILTKSKVMTLFSKGDEINVFVKTYGKPEAPDLVSDIKGNYDGNAWGLSPKVKLKEGEVAFIYAYSPYTSGLSNLTNIPVDISKQQDMLYSGNAVPVSYTTHQVNLTMKHALSLMSLNISNQGYSGKGELQSISIIGSEVFTSGIMNIENGKITGSGKEIFTMSVNKTIATNGWTEGLPQMWVIPFSTKANTSTLKAIIDGKTYEIQIPEVEMKSGFQYIFRLTLTNYGLEFIPNQTETISLNEGTDLMKQLEAYGVVALTHNSFEIAIPTFSGDNIFGSINWGDNTQESYSQNNAHTYTDTSNKRTIIETWNSTGFELKNLEGIEVVDVKEY